MNHDHAAGHPDMDYAEHRRTYSGFLQGTKILAGFVILLLIGMAIFLV
jgi:hypothetical protein